MYPKNAATPPRIAVGPVVQISDGAVQTSDVLISVTPEGGSASAGGGTTSYVNGVVHYVPTQAETNYTAFTVTAYKTGCIPVGVTVVTTDTATPGRVSVDRIGGQNAELSSDNRLRVDVAEWNDTPLATTNPLPNAAANAAGGLPISAAGGLDLDAQRALLDVLLRVAVFGGQANCGISAVNSTTELELSDGPANDFTGGVAIIVDNDGGGSWSAVNVVSYVVTSGPTTRTLTLENAPSFDVSTSDIVHFVGVPNPSPWGESDIKDGALTNAKFADNALTPAKFSGVFPTNWTSFLINGSGEVVASNMRGTDGAALATHWTSTRAAYVDNLSAGPMATQASVDSIQNSVRSALVIPKEYQLPSSGSERFRIDLLIYAPDAAGMEDPDGNTVTVSVANPAGTDRSGNLYDAESGGSATTAMNRDGVGQYHLFYEVDNADPEEQLNFRVSYAEGGNSMVDANSMTLVAISSGGGFNSSDRTFLTNVHNKLPTADYLLGTANADGSGYSTHTPVNVRTEVDDNSTKLFSIRENIEFIMGPGYIGAQHGLQAIRGYLESSCQTATGFSQHTPADVREDIDSSSAKLEDVRAEVYKIQRGASEINGGDPVQKTNISATPNQVITEAIA